MSAASVTAVLSDVEAFVAECVTSFRESVEVDGTIPEGEDADACADDQALLEGFRAGREAIDNLLATSLSYDAAMQAFSRANSIREFVDARQAMDAAKLQWRTALAACGGTP